MILTQCPGDSALHTLICFFGRCREFAFIFTTKQPQFCSFDTDCVTLSKMFLQITFFQSNTCSAVHSNCYDNRCLLFFATLSLSISGNYVSTKLCHRKWLIHFQSVHCWSFFLLFYLSVFADCAASRRLNGTTFKRKLNSTQWTECLQKYPHRNEFPCSMCFCCCRLDTIAINIDERLSMYCVSSRCIWLAEEKSSSSWSKELCNLELFLADASSVEGN